VHIPDNGHLMQQQSQRPEHFPNRYPVRPPLPTSAKKAPPAPQALHRLAWQTDQMRKRSEENDVKVADWSSFSQYVKKHYYEHGITCISWSDEGRQLPPDPPLPLLAPRPYPEWIAELLGQEATVDGIAPASRPLPFSEGLQLQQRGPSPQRQELHSSQAGALSQHAFAGGTFAADGAAGSVSALPSPGAMRTEAVIQSGPPCLQLSFKDWLSRLDSCGFLMQYHEALFSRFDSLHQVHSLKVRDGIVDSSFFDEIGISKLGHRRIIERWFRDNTSAV